AALARRPTIVRPTDLRNPADRLAVSENPLLQIRLRAVSHPLLDRPLMPMPVPKSTDHDPANTCPQAALDCRLAIFAMVARLQPVAAWMALQLWPAFSIEAMPALRATSSTRPLYLPSALALACPWACRRRRSS